MSRSGANNFTGTLGNANLISLAGESACCPDATEEETIASRDPKLHARERLRSHVTEDTLGASLRRCKTRLRGSNIPSATRQAATTIESTSWSRRFRRTGVIQPSSLGLAVSLENVEGRSGKSPKKDTEVNLIGSLGHQGMGIPVGRMRLGESGLGRRRPVVPCKSP